MSRSPEHVSICQHPNGEGVWWDTDKHGPGCIQDCDCTPTDYVRADIAEARVQDAADESYKLGFHAGESAARAERAS